MQRILAGIDTNGDDCGVRLRHGMVLLLLPHTSMLTRRAGARPVHPILGLPELTQAFRSARRPGGCRLKQKARSICHTAPDKC
jgi:hypothetical protein